MRLRTPLLFLSFVLFVSFFEFQKVAASDAPIAGGAAVGVQEGYGNLPLVFEANQGQTDAEVKFLSPVLSYSTYLGGSGHESNQKIAVDAAGNAYVAGCTDSVDFPTNKAIQPVLGGGSDLFVTKINASGTALVYSTYLGGTGDECVAGIAVDKAGNAYVAGNNGSVTKINTNGSRIVYSTHVDSSSVSDIAVDEAGNAYVTGSGWFDTPPIKGTAQCLGYCMFVTKINASGTAPEYSTYFSTWANMEWVSGIAVDQSGNVYVAGSTDRLVRLREYRWLRDKNRHRWQSARFTTPLSVVSDADS